MDFMRQLDILNPDKYLRFPLNVVGVGGIGSPLGFLVGKMGFDMVTAWDFDQLEDHNLPNTIYPLGDLGLLKVRSLGKLLKAFSGIKLIEKNERVTADTKFSGMVVSGVDSMAARREIWKAIKYKANVPLYIDGRMAAETFRVLTVRPTNKDDVSFYEETLELRDEDLPPPVCTAKAIIYNVFVISGIIGAQIKKFATGEEFPKEILFDLATYEPVVNW